MESYAQLIQLKAPGSLPINVLLFSDDAKYLLSAGDDEKVRVWNMETFKCEQILENSGWGQVTCLTWMYEELANVGTVITLCVGNARGSLALYTMDSQAVKPFSKQAICINAFKFNDPVEKQAFDKLNHRLAVASHSSELKMYTLSNAALKLRWQVRVTDGIPSALSFFGGANQSLLVASLESSEITCRNAATNMLMWKTTLMGGIGCAAFSSDQTLMLINNLTSGNFDVYNILEDSPLRSLPVGSTRRFIKQCQFLEGTKVAVCGSDTNKVYVVDVANNYVVQTLVTGKEKDMTQTVTVTPASSRRVLIAGSSGGSVHVWEKGTNTTALVVKTSKSRSAFFEYNVHICLLIVFVSLPIWYRDFCEIVIYLRFTRWSNTKTVATIPSEALPLAVAVPSEALPLTVAVSSEVHPLAVVTPSEALPSTVAAPSAAAIASLD